MNCRNGNAYRWQREALLVSPSGITGSRHELFAVSRVPFSHFVVLVCNFCLSRFYRTKLHNHSLNFLKLIRTTNYTNFTNSYFRKYEGLLSNFTNYGSTLPSIRSLRSDSLYKLVKFDYNLNTYSMGEFV